MTEDTRDQNAPTAVAGKDVTIHIGPHKTGTSSIQAALSRGRAQLLARDIAYLHDGTNGKVTKLSAELTKSLCDQQYDAAAESLDKLSKAISALPNGRVLISYEDFSGHYPGRGGVRRVYPTLLTNLKLIAQKLAPHRVRFVFFEREQEEWLYSCYGQVIRFRLKFSRFSDYRATMRPTPWEKVLEDVIKNFGENFIVFPYKRDPFSGLNNLLSLFDMNAADLKLETFDVLSKNLSLEPYELYVYERINAHAFVHWLVPTYKKRASAYIGGDRPYPLCDNTEISPTWPRDLSGNMFIGLEGLTARAHLRISTQEDQPDLLPPIDIDLRQLAEETLSNDVELPDTNRRQIEDQYRILEYHLRGNSRLAFVNALAISYLRRDTAHTDKARKIFHRIWQETGLYLVTELSTRWLLSTLQTFLDHPVNQAQQVIGASGYFYGNMLKIYEGERAIEGREPDAIYKNTEPSTKGGFRGLDRYRVGGTDLLLNTNAMLLEIASLDPVAGLVLEELLLRTSRSKTVFSRADAARLHHKIDTPPFNDVWSFFEIPES